MKLPLNAYAGAFPPGDPNHGLTKREYFAVHILAGLLASESEDFQHGDTKSETAEIAVMYADYLLTELAQCREDDE